MKRIIFISSIGGHLEQLLKLKKILKKSDYVFKSLFQKLLGVVDIEKEKGEIK